MSEHTRPFSRRAFVGGAAAFGISLCLPPLMPAKAHAVTAAEKQAEANAALEKLNAMQEKLDRAEVSLYAAETERDDAQARMDEAQGRIDSASSRISELQDKLGNRARSMYRSGSSTFLDLLLGATTFQAFASNWDLLNDMNQNDADMVEETKTLRSEVESEKAVYEEQRNVAAQKAEEAEAVKKEAESLVSQMQDTYNSLSEEAAQLLAEEEAAREAAALAAAQAAEEEARRQAEEEERRQQQSNSGGNSGGGSSSGGNSGGSTTGLGWPLKGGAGRISSGFGGRKSPTAGASTYHKGVDLAALSGTPILAAGSGKVVIATYSSSAGNYIMISHGNRLYTVYMHCSRLAASAGKQVTKGQVIGYVGSTGISTGAHLHFGVTKNGNYVNPLNYISR